ncbi:hypothetical protein RAS12_30700 (plasmid) [Achromobacter seleniivolatilans]|uniref:Transmembrane protein n=1 Tax=Achromobacter seleniivolatilans TaxID=3047478 RepID=A0ABY9MBM9_9BURK|nr:hypothetical protein [Achromobacter sp. R39]WMD24004.1 hypothetical protein RAS12_30700 [Achromobacter sp. R39]
MQRIVDVWSSFSDHCVGAHFWLMERTSALVYLAIVLAPLMALRLYTSAWIWAPAFFVVLAPLIVFFAFVISAGMRDVALRKRSRI